MTDKHLLFWIFKAIADNRDGASRDRLLNEDTWKSMAAPDWVFPAIRERYAAFDQVSAPQPAGVE